MAKILPFQPSSSAFDAETTARVVAAYDKAIIGLHDKGQPEVVREVMARRIIALAAAGERDVEKLCSAALNGFGITR
jgi:hypothetical protein